MININDEQKERMMNEIIQNIKEKREKLPYERTIYEFMDEAGVSFGTAKRTLYRLVKEGKMNKRTITTEHGWMVVFSCVA